MSFVVVVVVVDVVVVGVVGVVFVFLTAHHIVHVDAVVVEEETHVAGTALLIHMARVISVVYIRDAQRSDVIPVHNLYAQVGQYARIGEHDWQHRRLVDTVMNAAHDIIQRA